MIRKRLQSQVLGFVLASCAAGVALAGDVGGNVYSSPGTIQLTLEWGSSFENSKEISVIGDGAYSFGVNIRNNTKYRVVGTGAPAGWACRGKQIDRFLNRAAETQTHVYCGTSSSVDGVRIGTWNLEWYDSTNALAKKQAIASLIDQYNFDVLILTEVLDAASWDEFLANHLASGSEWDYRITDSGCSLRKVTMWRTAAVDFLSGYELSAANTGGLIDEGGATWSDCGGRRPFVADFSVRDSDLEFTTASIHFKALSGPSDCQRRKDQVDTFVEWVGWAGMDARNFIAIGDFNDELPGTGICNSIEALAAMKMHPDFVFATAQPNYDYALMMGNGLVTFDTKSFQSTIDHVWLNARLLERLQATDTYGNAGNAVQANMKFTDFGSPDHNPPYISLQR